MYVTRASRAHTNMNETKPPKLPRRARGTHMRARRGARARRSLFSRAFDTHDDGQLTDGQREERARTERPSERDTLSCVRDVVVGKERMYMTHRTVGSVFHNTLEVTRGWRRVAFTRTEL